MKETSKAIVKEKIKDEEMKWENTKMMKNIFNLNECRPCDTFSRWPFEFAMKQGKPRLEDVARCSSMLKSSSEPESSSSFDSSLDINNDNNSFHFHHIGIHIFTSNNKSRA
jgi:hypothetical protein